MITEETKSRALEVIRKKYAGGESYSVSDSYENVLGGQIVTIKVIYPPGADQKEAYPLVHFGPNNAVETFQYSSELLRRIAAQHKGGFGRWFERQAVEALVPAVLVLTFCVLMIIIQVKGKSDPAVVDIMKMGMTGAVGYYLGGRVGKHPKR